MILLKINLTLQSDQPKPALAASLFLGGVLHGSFEHLVRLHAPAIADEIGMREGSQLKYYSVLPPPYGWQPQTFSDTSFLDCGIMLFSKAKQYLQTIILALQHWHEIRLDGRIDKIKQCEIYVCNPGNRPQLWCESNRNLIEHFELDFNHAFAASHDIQIKLITPLILESKQQKAITSPTAPPGLLRIVRSLTGRIQKLEPQLALSLGILSTAWIEAEEQIRHLPVTAHALQQVQWKYGSRTKPRPILRKGLIGQIGYTGHVPAAIVAALNWGCWFGIGQGTAMGQGMYTVSTTERR